ncbi:MAG: TlpA disulfide reductase family protein [Pirellulaceae bacterium]
MKWQFLATGLLAVSVASGVSAQEAVKETFSPSGIVAKMGGYRPIRAEMDQQEDIVSKAPADLANPKYGYIEQGDKKWAFILDEPEEGEAKLYVDTNGDGDLTNDPESSWKSEDRDGLTFYSGETKIQLAEGKVGAVNAYRFDPTDSRREQLKNTLLYYFDFGTEYTVRLDEQEFDFAAAGMLSNGDAVSVDRDGNGKLSRNYERIELGKPFNFTGTTYLLSADDGTLTLAKADEELPQAPMPPDLSIGKPALNFSAQTIDGETVNFPGDYKGKIVMVDFWATWCGPCVGEIPNMKEAYADWHDQGFEILGISFDQEDMTEKLQEYRKDKELPWPQIYEGKGWNTSLGNQHDVSAIPFVMLVDGDSGEILALSRQLRGKGLTKAIKKQLIVKGLVEASDDDKEDEDDDSEGEEGGGK